MRQRRFKIQLPVAPSGDVEAKRKAREARRDEQVRLERESMKRAVKVQTEEAGRRRTVKEVALASDASLAGALEAYDALVKMASLHGQLLGELRKAQDARNAVEQAIQKLDNDLRERQAGIATLAMRIQECAAAGAGLSKAREAVSDALGASDRVWSDVPSVWRKERRNKPLRARAVEVRREGGGDGYQEGGTQAGQEGEPVEAQEDGGGGAPGS